MKVRKVTAVLPASFRALTLIRALAPALLSAGLILISACGELRPLPATLDLKEYTPIDYQELQDPGRAGLHAGQKVRVQAYFWEFLSYDPAMIRNYLTLPRYPIRWYRLQWFATYGSEEMKGYYDLAAINPDQLDRYHPKRLDPILIYGEVSSLAPGYYLRVHHLEKIEGD